MGGETIWDLDPHLVRRIYADDSQWPRLEGFCKGEKRNSDKGMYNEQNAGSMMRDSRYCGKGWDCWNGNSDSGKGSLGREYHHSSQNWRGKGAFHSDGETARDSEDTPSSCSSSSGHNPQLLKSRVTQGESKGQRLVWQTASEDGETPST